MKTKVIFTLPAANLIGADGCVLLGEFNNWNLEEGHYLTKQADGSMQVEVELEAGKEYQYRYLLSNGRWVNDNSEKVVSDVLGFPVENCIIHVAEIKVEKTAVKPKTAKPKAKAKPKPVVPVKDNFAKIEGIGRKIESLLYKNKIYSYKQLSKATIKSLKEMLEAAGNKYAMHNPGTWPKQAKLAAEGKWEDLELLQKHLKGGK
ncbi:MAG: glycoside hydrolase family 13 [Ferruginibacter sp.]